MYFEKHEIGFEESGRSVTVPSNDVAKLMYYLHCVCTVIDCHNDVDMQRLVKYENWYNLSTDEKKQLLVFCYAFSPDVFDNKVFFHSPSLCRDRTNRFYKIHDTRYSWTYSTC